MAYIMNSNFTTYNMRLDRTPSSYLRVYISVFIVSGLISGVTMKR